MPTSDERDLSLRWSGRLSLKSRILAVNIFALAILAGSLFYLDSFRHRLTEARVAQATVEARLSAAAMSAAVPERRAELLRTLGASARVRLQLYTATGTMLMDSWEGASPTYRLIAPEDEPWPEQAARHLDNGFDALMRSASPERLSVPLPQHLQAWPEAVAALKNQAPRTALRQTPNGMPFVSAAAPVTLEQPAVLLLTDQASDVTQIVRDERLTLVIILAATIALSVLLSNFLARTIELPLRRLARAAQRVRLGRAREVAVPRLPARRDEIGLLARALYDMTQSLRNRIDATEAFAADLTHELKNPLASLRSAVDTLEHVEDPGLRRQLLDVVRQDVGRLDRLIGDIAELSRLDAELSRARFEPVDLGALVRNMLDLWKPLAAEREVRLRFTGTGRPSSIMGEESRLSRMLVNVIDNALSFSPKGGVIDIALAEELEAFVLTVSDQGPGVPPDAREAIFKRFHSIRPESEDFGRHSGLGLAIARAIAAAHDGTIAAQERDDGRRGARFVIRLPKPAP